MSTRQRRNESEMASFGGERNRLLQLACESVQQAADNESWGLFVEAVEELQKARRKLTAAVGPDAGPLSAEVKELLLRISQALQLQASSIQNLSSVEEPSSSGQINLRVIGSALQELYRGGSVAEILQCNDLDAALPQLTANLHLPSKPRPLLLSDDDYSEAVAGKAGSLVQRTTTLPGHTYLTISIDRIGLKDPQNYIDPFITVSVKTKACRDVEPPQDTPVSTQREGSYVVFDMPVELQKPTDEFPEGSAIFFEFKHYKPKKGNISTRCFSFMEMDEIKPGKAFLEIYKKPTDFSRKKLSLLSVKPLYLHLVLMLTRT